MDGARTGRNITEAERASTGINRKIKSDFIRDFEYLQCLKPFKRMMPLCKRHTLFDGTRLEVENRHAVHGSDRLQDTR